MEEKLLFIGRMDSDSERGRDGVRIKNRVFYAVMQSLINRTTFIDLDKIRHPFVFVSLLKQVYSYRRHSIVFASGGSTASCTMLRMLQIIVPPKSFIVLGLGGNMHYNILSNESNLKVMQKCRAVLVEGQEMTRILFKNGLSNVHYVPNFKAIPFIPKKEKRDYKRIKFLFFARISPFKGCNLIFEAIDKLRADGYIDKFEVHFYGMMLAEYKKEFEERIEINKDVAVYHGVLNATSKETYIELAQYDVMLFPTFWHDEGFPASLVDAFIAGLPVIASDWNQNSEIIKDGENGFLIPPHDSMALAERMQFLISNPRFIEDRIKMIQQCAVNYDTNHVLSQQLLQTIGLC